MISYDFICVNLKNHKRSAFYPFLLFFIFSAAICVAQETTTDSLHKAKRDSLKSLLKTRRSPAALSVYKTNPFSILWGPIPLTAEYKVIAEMAVDPHSSFLAGISYLGKSPFLAMAEYANRNSNNNGNTVTPVQLLKISGWRFQAAYRFYPGKAFAPRGFYLGPQVSYSYAKFSDKSQNSNYYYLSITHFNINLLTGYQLIISDRLAFDFFFGLGYKNNVWTEHNASSGSQVISFDNSFPPYSAPLKVTLGTSFGVAF